MKAFIEYPDVSDDRIEIKGEFVVETQACFLANTEVSRNTRRLSLDRIMEDDVFDDGSIVVDGVEMEPKQERYRGDDEYWKDEC
jgi:hypothetical protein